MGTSTKLGAFIRKNKKQARTTSYAASEFRRETAQVKRSELKRIEHKMRFGEKQVKLLRMPRVKVARGTT